MTILDRGLGALAISLTLVAGHAQAESYVFRSKPSVIGASGNSGGGQTGGTGQPGGGQSPATCSLRVALADGGTYSRTMMELWYGSVSSASGELPPGGHFELETAEKVGFEIDPASGDFVVQSYAPGQHPIRFSYVPDEGADFQACSTSVTANFAWAEVGHTFDVAQCSPSRFGFNMAAAGDSFETHTALPSGFSIAADGMFEGTTSLSPGVYGPNIAYARAGGAMTSFTPVFDIRVLPSHKVHVNQTAAANARVGQAYFVNFGFNEGYSTDYSYSFSPALPSWLSRVTTIDAATGGWQFEGTPTQAGTFTTTATLRNACGNTYSQQVTITIQ